MPGFATSGYENRCMLFSWQLDSQDVIKNSSTITWKLTGYGGDSSKWYSANSIKLTIDGIVVYNNKEFIKLWSDTLIASGSMIIQHENSGEKSISASVEGNIYLVNGLNATGHGTWSIQSIPRKAVIVEAQDFTDESSPVVSYRNIAGENVENIGLRLLIDKTIIADYREVSKTNGHYKFVFSQIEKERMWDATKNSINAKVSFELSTKIGGAWNYSVVHKTLTIVNSQPSINPSVYDSNNETSSLTKNRYAFIRFASNCTYDFGAVLKKKSTMKQSKLICEGTEYNGLKGTIRKIGGSHENPDRMFFSFELTDSRGQTVKKTLNQIAYDYISPTVYVKSASISSNGTLTFKMEGRCYNKKFGTNENNYRINYRIKLSTDAEFDPPLYLIDGSDFVFSSGTFDSTYTITKTLTHNPDGSGPLDSRGDYEIEVRIRDSISDYIAPIYKVISRPIFEISKDGVNFETRRVTGPILSLNELHPSNIIRNTDSSGQRPDMNRYTEPGVYSFPSNTYAANALNMPTKMAGVFTVMSTTGLAVTNQPYQYIAQFYITATGVASADKAMPIFVRWGSTGSSGGKWIWQKWKTIPIV